MTSPAGFDAYACPRCHGELAPRDAALRCAACARDYPVERGVPDFTLTDLGQVSLSSPALDGRVAGGSGALDLAAVSRAVQRFKWQLWARAFDTPFFWDRLVRGAVMGASFTSNDLFRGLESRLALRGGHVLDAGCGVGNLTWRAANGERTIHGVDVLAQAVRFASRHVARKGGAGCYFARAAVQALPFRDATFDAVLFGGTIHWVFDPAPALREIRRTMKPGARVAGYTALAGGRSATGRGLERGDGRAYTEAQIAAFFRDAAFVDFEREIVGELVIFSATA